MGRSTTLGATLKVHEAAAWVLAFRNGFLNFSLLYTWKEIQTPFANNLSRKL
jgi:hypothetical protein